MNLESETRNGYFISADMKKVWAVELELLKKLLEVCKKHHLKIWAEGGTLLGTVRHHGYIPWDDDIDVAMLRDDYDKLQAIAKDEFKAPFFFQSGYTDIFPNGMTRLRMDGTAAILPQSVFQECHQGIFIDIFPVDVIPDNKEERDAFNNIRNRKKQELVNFCEHHWSLVNWKYDWVILKTKIKIRQKGFRTAFREYDQFVKQYAGTDNHYVSIISWNYNKKYHRKTNWYKDTIIMPFEDISMPVPSGFNDILTQQYGDYMKPVKETTMHGMYGGFEALDTTKSYLEYLPTIRKRKNKEAWGKKISRFKHYLQFKSFKKDEP